MHGFYNEMKPLYVETAASGVGLRATLLQTRMGASSPRDEGPNNNILIPIAFMNKSLLAVEWRYSKIERKVLAILDGLEKFHHYCSSGR